MRVLHVIPSLGPSRGGPSAMAPPLCRALLRAGVECDLVATNDDGETVMDVETGTWTEFCGVRTWFHRRWDLAGPSISEFQLATGFARWLRDRMGDYDLFHIHALFSYLPTHAMWAARRSGVPYVVRPCGLLERVSMARRSMKKRIYLGVIERRNLDGASAMHLTSQRELAESDLPDRVSRWVVPPGVELEYGLDRAEVARGSGEPRILFLSRWAEKKRIGLLLEGLGQIRDLQWTLVLAGSDSPEEIRKIDGVAQKFGLRDRVTYPGFLRGADKWAAMRAADVLVLPSVSENFGVSVAEALAVGLPVIVTKGVALAVEIDQAQAGWVSGERAAELAACLRSAIGDPRERTRRGENAFSFAGQHLCWDACARTLVDRYGEVVQTR